MYPETGYQEPISIASNERRSTVDLAYISLALFVPVAIYWIIWVVCYWGNDSPSERLEMFFSLVPREVFGLSSHVVVLLLSLFSAVLAIIEKFKRGTYWYETANHIRLAIIFPLPVFFFNVVQIMM